MRSLTSPCRRPLALVIAAGLLAASCGGGADEAPAPAARPPATPAPLGELPSPARIAPPSADGAFGPQLSRRADGTAILSWLQPVATGMAVQWSALEPQAAAWTAAREIVASDKVLANAADTPGVLSLGNGFLLAHWRETREPEGSGMDVRVSLSLDGGQAWDKPVTPHRDGTDTEHGFLVAWDASQPLNGAEAPKRGRGDLAGSGAEGNGTAGGSAAVLSGEVPFEAGLAWLDGREAAATPQAFAARIVSTTLGSGGMVALGVENVLDPRTCDCCPMALAKAGDITLLAYRDRTEGDLRDIAVLRRDATNTWSAPVRVHEDAWHVVGCPVNGPALDADGARAALAWFTASQDDPRVLLAFSSDQGASWSEPRRVDDAAGGMTAGQPALAQLPDGSVIVAWLLRRDDTQVLQARRMSASGEPGPVLEIAEGVTGLTRMLRAGSRVVLAWTERAPEATETRRLATATWAVDAIAK